MEFTEQYLVHNGIYLKCGVTQQWSLAFMKYGFSQQWKFPGNMELVSNGNSLEIWSQLAMEIPLLTKSIFHEG